MTQFPVFQKLSKSDAVFTIVYGTSDDFMREVVSVFLYLLQFPSYDVINDVIMSDADCTPGREPRSVAAS